MVLLSLQKWNWLITHMLDGDGESVLKALEEANPQTIEPRTIWQTSFLLVQEL